jgi:hypothetical protein
MLEGGKWGLWWVTWVVGFKVHAMVHSGSCAESSSHAGFQYVVSRIPTRPRTSPGHGPLVTSRMACRGDLGSSSAMAEPRKRNELCWRSSDLSDWPVRTASRAESPSGVWEGSQQHIAIAHFVGVDLI